MGKTSDQLEDLLLRTIPAHRWLDISQRLDKTVEFILQSTLCMMIVAANEQHRKAQAAAGERVADDFARFLNMSFLDLADAAGLNEEDEPEVDEPGPKSDDTDPVSGDSGPVLAGSGDVLPDHPQNT